MRWGEAREGWKIERVKAGRDGDGGGQEKSELEPQELLRDLGSLGRGGPTLDRIWEWW